MGECAFHPGVETNVRCAECGRYICPKDMVTTPVGYKCRECARPARSARNYVKPRQWAFGAAAAIVAGILGALLLALTFYISWWTSAIYGVVVAEATRRGAGGHRHPGLGAIAAGVSALALTIAASGPVSAGIAGAVAFAWVASNRL